MYVLTVEYNHTGRFNAVESDLAYADNSKLGAQLINTGLSMAFNCGISDFAIEDSETGLPVFIYSLDSWKLPVSDLDDLTDDGSNGGHIGAILDSLEEFISDCREMGFDRLL